MHSIEEEALAEAYVRHRLSETEPQHDERVAAGAADVCDAEEEPPPSWWPAPPAAHAFLGLAGRFVEVVSPASEADPVALLLQFLVGAGAMIGRNAHYMVEGDRHYCNLFALLVGPTASGRKGISWGQVRRVLQIADPAFVAGHIVSGLSSGEGLIYNVRDPRYGIVKKKGPEAGKEQLIDEGVSDKRLLVMESEFAGALKVMAREGNQLSPVLRLAWDGLDLRTLVKNDPNHATGAHVAIVGHITAEELRRRLDATEVANGFLNRFILIVTRRSKYLPDGGHLDSAETAKLGNELGKAVQFGQALSEIKRDDGAKALWRDLYPALSDGTCGRLGMATSRGAAQVTRLSCIYAVLGRSPVIAREHLLAAHGLWRYVVASSEYVFGQSLANPVAERIWSLLGDDGEGLTRTEIYRAFGSHVASRIINDALRELESSRRIERVQIPGAGRSTERIKRAQKAHYAQKAPTNGEGTNHNALNTLNTQPHAADSADIEVEFEEPDP